MSDVAARQRSSFARTGDVYTRKRAAEIFKLLTVTYDSDKNPRQVYQAIFKSSTFPKHWRSRELTADRVDALLGELDGGTVGPRRTSTRDASEAESGNDDARKEEPAEDDAGKLRTALSELLKRPIGENISSRDVEETYYLMLLEKSKAIKLSEERIRRGCTRER